MWSLYIYYTLYYYYYYRAFPLLIINDLYIKTLVFYGFSENLCN